MNIWMTLEKAAFLYPDKTAIIDGPTAFTYKQAKARAESLACFLRENGIHKGDRIAICEVNSYAFFECYYAAAGLGAVLCPINYRLSAREMAFIINDSGARWLISGSRFGAVIREATAETPALEGILWIGTPHAVPERTKSAEYEAVMKTRESAFTPAEIDGDRIAHLYYTSGTTGRPKGVILTHKNVCVHALATIAELQLTDTDVWGHIAPMFHLADAWATFAVTWAGGTHVMVGQFEPEPVMAVIVEKRITLSNLIPTMLNLIVKHPKVKTYDFSSLRVVLSGGAPIAPELIRMIMETFGCDYIQTYGMTETSPYLTFSLLKDHLRQLPEEEQLMYKSKTGRPFMAVELKVVDDQLNPVAPDGRQVGEIMVKGDTVTPGYWNRPEESEKAFVDGWLRTGDLAVMDAEGYVNIVDRKKDMILSGGENIYSTEVEYVLYMNPKILEAAVFGVPDETWGEAVKAAVVLKPGETATPEELIAFCKTHLASYKAPKSVDFIEALPKTGSGKIFKKALRDPYWQGKTTTPSEGIS
ncbi:MAG: long-chain-fatty-acid--CoA ligase [Deltaproteobacteria bacterium]|nr:long-chain-fatty-acid--CoA ligase [Deltaproteobacteria bacterium]MBW1955618.1 long-chain-fatty-acid--CoA ligase [Deltaproteobacteria bacterium]MBW2042908.1 long-chain-fatty-acid--CoA ligase [Deltaproteobacteria bacterium]MBW2132648.1 long-chain-fatty-acid--CoA ligase [Deltaproteobacteria bacterium]